MINLPRSTYYYRSGDIKKQIDDLALIALIADVHDVFPGYAYRRVTLELKARGHVINHKRVASAMKENGLNGRRWRSFKPTSGAEVDLAISPNLYRNIVPTAPDRVGVADITYSHITSGFIYLAVILDACSRKVIGYALSKRIDTPLALAALNAAYTDMHPVAGTCIPHSDRGCQYASTLYRGALAELGLIGSMSALANPYHNAQAEFHEDTEGGKNLFGRL